MYVCVLIHNLNLIGIIQIEIKHFIIMFLVSKSSLKLKTMILINQYSRLNKYL